MKQISRQGKILAVALCDAGMMALAVGVNLLPVFLTTLSHDLGGARGLTAEQLGRIGAVTFAGLVIAILGFAPLADRWGARLFAVGGNVLIGAGLIALSKAPGYDAVLLSAFAMGIGAGALDLVLSPIISELQPERRTAAMNLLHSFYCFGAVATILLASMALRWGVSWRTVAIGISPMMMLLAAAFCFVPLPPMVQHGESRTPLAALLRNGFFIGGMIAIFLGGATELGMSYWLPAYAERTLGYPRWFAGLGLLGFSLSMAIARVGIGFLPRSLGPIRLMLLCSASCIACYLVASFSHWSAPALICCVLVGLSGSCLWPSALAVVADRFPLGGASMFAVLSMLGNLGGVVMPWVVGAVADRSSLRIGLATGTLCPIGLIAILLWMRRRTALDIGPIPTLEASAVP